MSLTYDEILDSILLESGQYVGGLDATLLKKENIVKMIKRELAYYSKHRVNKGKGSFTLYNKKVFSVEKDGVIPKAITKIERPVLAEYLYPGSGGKRYGDVSNYYWRYSKPRLDFNLPEDLYYVEYFVDHEYDEDSESIPDLTYKDTTFLDLICGRFMMTVGRGNSAFTIPDLPIETNSRDLISAGQQLYEDARRSVTEGNDFWEAIIV